MYTILVSIRGLYRVEYVLVSTRHIRVSANLWLILEEAIGSKMLRSGLAPGYHMRPDTRNPRTAHTHTHTHPPSAPRMTPPAARGPRRPPPPPCPSLVGRSGMCIISYVVIARVAPILSHTAIFQTRTYINYMASD